MSAEAAALSRTWSVGRWRVTLTMPRTEPGQVRQGVLEWSPTLPNRPLTKSEMRQYRAGRDRAIGELAVALGGPALLVEAAS
jgi:hypothetical protein